MNYKRILILAFAIWTGYILIQAACTSSDTQAEQPAVTYPVNPSDTIGQKLRHGAQLEPKPDTIVNLPRKTFGNRMKKKIEWESQRVFRLERAPDGTIRFVDDGNYYANVSDLETISDTSENPIVQAAAKAAMMMNEKGELGPVDIDAFLNKSLTEKSAATAVLGISDIEFVWKGYKARTWAIDAYAASAGLDNGDEIEQMVSQAMVCENDPARGDGMMAAEEVFSQFGLSFDGYCQFFAKMGGF